LVGFVASIPMLKHVRKHWTNDKAPVSAYLALVFGCVLLFASFVGLVHCLSSFEAAMSALFNPEYWALQEVLEQLK
jgi:hypothetical protein